VTDETPSADEPTGADPAPAPDAESASAPEPAAAGEPAAPAPAPESASVAPEPATAAEPPPAEPPTAETATPPTVSAAAPAAAPTAVPVAGGATPPSERSGGIWLPTWLAALLAVLLIGGLGFAIGYISADDDDSNPGVAANSQPIPNRGNQGNLPNGGNLPGFPGNGNSNGNGNGPGNGGTATASGAFLGVSVEDAANDAGASITAVRSGSPAADAGLKEGDVITKVDTTDVKSGDDLIQAVRGHDPGDDVTVTYTRDGNSAQVTVHLGDRSDIARSSLPS
jgi:membrane-associated protease RseP (regulator of RpoE activity)